MKNLGNSEDRASGSERGGGMGSVKKTEKKGRWETEETGGM